MNQRARRVYPRERVIAAWEKSKYAVYLIYPETAAIPANRSGDWETSTGNQARRDADKPKDSN
jgi:hypothetical protein